MNHIFLACNTNLLEGLILLSRSSLFYIYFSIFSKLFSLLSYPTSLCNCDEVGIAEM
ncbi:hypothetical protein OIU79_014741 [Salix purpurea]|uniref:Uncharacterized protein n=1 Tax=Salix purpurea TaxID=77065 RepID=A0A9Q0SXG8_SALPP|nr:hypothetical protein OIU79_014741 [Salix purpurea]